MSLREEVQQLIERYTDVPRAELPFSIADFIVISLAASDEPLDQKEILLKILRNFTVLRSYVHEELRIPKKRLREKADEAFPGFELAFRSYDVPLVFVPNPRPGISTAAPRYDVETRAARIFLKSI